ncbi:RHS repeat-associated core domain-containing protein [Xanthomonas sp. NCPPB 3005]|uniref:RHS repeat-associated core domain-containing protein n=1 Tax=Xanthomonas sp. NCPPB 3005 TaxID=3240913 RepID=UPI003518A7D2
MKINILLLVFFIVFIPQNGRAQTAANFCYENGQSYCYKTLAAAEAKMRADIPRGDLLRQASSDQYNSDSQGKWSLTYEIPDQPPEKIFPDGYDAGGGFSAGKCLATGNYIFPTYCISEQGAIDAAMARFREGNPQCEHVEKGVEGVYGDPFVEIRRYDGRYGEIKYETPSSRYLTYTAWCAAWSPPKPPVSYKLQLSKKGSFLCAAGFAPRDGFSANFASSNAAVVEYPFFCRAEKRTAFITFAMRQSSSCAANANPCYPATGDKARVETDFVFAGLSFNRYYHSLRQVVAKPWLSTGWSVTFSDRIKTNGYGLYYISENGYVEEFKSYGSSLTEYFSTKNRNRKLVKSAVGYVLSDSSGMVLVFDAGGRLTSRKHLQGPTITFSYNGDFLVKAMDEEGRALDFNYIAGRLARIDLPDGRGISYLYDSQENLSEAVLGDGVSKRYHYNESGLSGASDVGLLTGITDESGSRYASFGYDAFARVISSELYSDAHRVVEATHLGYVNDTRVDVVDALGQVRAYSISSEGIYRRIIGISDGISTDSNVFNSGAISRHVKNGVVTDYAYSNGYLASITRAAGTTSEKVSVFTRDNEFRLLSLTTRVGGATEIGSTNYTYSSSGKIASTTVVDAGTGGQRRWTMSYCGDNTVSDSLCPFSGKLFQVDGPRPDTADVTTYTYYLSDDVLCVTSPTTCPHRKGDLWKVTNALGQVTEYLAYDGAGRVLSVKDANGTITDYTYHARGWLTASKVRGADDSSESDDRITRIDYWPTGLVKQVTQPDGAFTAFTYDAAHRLTDIADNAGNTLHYTLDNAGNRVKEDTKDASGTLKRTLSRVYNQLGQLATQATANGDPTDFGYDANGNTAAVTDAIGHKTQNDYDPLNRLARTLQDVGGIAAETKFGYDALDNLTKVTDPKGLDTTYAYNGLGDLTKLTSPDTGVTTYTYDSAGNRATQTDARGVTTAYGYDALNRLTGVAYPDADLNVTYTYDVSQTTCASGETYAVGRLASMQDGSGTTDYCYDRFGDLVRKVQTTNGKVFVLRYAYTKAGQLSRLTYPDGAAVDYVRNAQGQTTEVGVTPAGGTRQVLLGNATYYPFGPVAGWSYGNGRPMQRVLDQDYRPLAVSDTRSDGLSTGFAFDPAGNLSALTAAGNTAPVVSLDYDALGRLTAFKDGPTGTVIDGYSYDATGNRLSAKINTSTQSYTYPTTSHRLSAVAGTARTYDAIGNTLSIGGTAQEFVYDATGRMSQAKRAGTVVMKYGYNGRGEQVRRVDKTNTYTLYDESGHWLGNYDANGASLQQAIWLDDLPVGVLAKNSLRYVQPDHLGSPRAVIDPVRDVAIWTWDMKGEAFGNTSPDQDPDKDGTAFVFDMRFPGQRYDAATGFNQNYFRDYDPSTGRYGQSDPIGLEGGFSTYSYVEAAPFRYSDIFGLVKHTSGRWIDCGKGCRIRIDFTYDEKTGRRARHLHWECKGAEGECGEYGGESHGGTWDDAPKSIKECALRNGFSGRSVTNENYSPMVQSPEISAGAKAAIYVGGAVIIIFSALTGAGS